MAKLVLTNPEVTVDSNDLSNYVRSLTFTPNFEEVDTTAFQDSVRDAEAGLEDLSLQLEFIHDADFTNLEAILWPLRGTKVTVTWKPDAGATSTSNPQYSATALISQLPMSGSVGDVLSSSVTWRLTSSITRSTS